MQLVFSIRLKINKKETVLKFFNGTEGRSRTDTVSPPPDFESGASTNSATPAKQGRNYNKDPTGNNGQTKLFSQPFQFLASKLHMKPLLALKR